MLCSGPDDRNRIWSMEILDRERCHNCVRYLRLEKGSGENPSGGASLGVKMRVVGPCVSYTLIPERLRE